MDDQEGVISWCIIGAIVCLLLSDVLHRLTFRMIEKRLDRLEGRHG